MRRNRTRAWTGGLLAGALLLTGCDDVGTQVLDTVFLALQIAGLWV